MFLLQAAVVADQTGTSLTADAARVGNDVANFIQQVNWAAPTWDLFIVLFFIATVFIYGLSLGRDRIIVILVSIYLALAVVSNAPFISQLRDEAMSGSNSAVRVTAFIAVFVTLFLLLSRSVLVRTFGNLAAGRWWQVLIFSIFHVGLLVSITLSFLPVESVSHLAPLTQQLFSSDYARFFWIVAPIAALMLMKAEPDVGP